MTQKNYKLEEHVNDWVKSNSQSLGFNMKLPKKTIN